MSLIIKKLSIEDRRNKILYGNIVETLISLSFPIILMNIVAYLITFSDGVFLNRSSSIAVAGAIGFSSPVVNMLTSIAQGISTGSLAIMGQLNGKGETEKTKFVASQTMTFAFLSGLLLAPISILLAFILSKNVNPSIAPYVFEYLSMYAIIFPFVSVSFVFNSIKNAFGQPEATLIRMSLLLILKLIFNYLFLFKFNMGISGLILASFLSYIILSIWMIYDLYFKKSDAQLIFSGFKLNKTFILQLLKISVPAIFANAMVFMGFFLIGLEVERYGPVALTAQSISANINSLLFTLPSAISSTVTVMVSMNIGVGNKQHAKRIFYNACLISLCIAGIIIVAFLPYNVSFIKLFRQEPEIVKLANEALTIYVFSIIPFGLFMVVQGVFIGLGRTTMPLVAGFVRVWLARFVFIKLTISILGIYAIFWGNLFSNAFAAVLFLIALFKIPWTSKISDKIDKLNIKFN